MLQIRFLKAVFKFALFVTLLIFVYDYANKEDIALVTILKSQWKHEKQTRLIPDDKNVILRTSSTRNQSCEWMTITNRSSDDSQPVQCQLPAFIYEDCQRLKLAYGSFPSSRACPREKTTIVAEICHVTTKSFRRSDDSSIEIVCNMDLCKGSPVRIGLLQPHIGTFPPVDQWIIATSKRDLDRAIREAISQTAMEGFEFCLLTCTPGDKIIKQALLLPPLIHTDNFANVDPDLFNVNVVVLDSVSREHFYRQLPHTVEVLRRTNLDSSIKAKVFDFEMFQSLAPRTFPNIRAFFSGAVDVDKDDNLFDYNMTVLLGHYRYLGYQFLLQEDSCWLDTWGSLFTGNKHNLNSSVAALAYRWQNIQNSVDVSGIDSTGVSHLTCEVFLQYGTTNQFNDPPKVCFNGKYLSSYFLSFMDSYLQKVESVKGARPLFSYTHLNVGHEKTGKRISYLDDDFSSYVEKWSSLKNTITIIFSDHGPKTTKYSQDSVGGRYETSHAFLFVIVPSGVEASLGLDSMNALTINQRRLVSTIDLHEALSSVGKPYYEGLFSRVSSSHDCSYVPIYAFAQCICSDNTKLLPDMDNSTHWLAEFATGYLNNLIQDQFLKSQNYAVIGGYGNCERLLGLEFTKIKVKRRGDTRQYLFDLTISRYKLQELFEVAIETNDTGNQLPKIINWRRVTIFQHFSKCLDKGVSIDLCICRKESYGVVNPARDVARVLSQDIYGLTTEVSYQDSKCLALLTRRLKYSMISYELTNMCSDRYYLVSFKVEIEEEYASRSRLTTKLPTKLLVLPWSLHYITTVSINAGHWSYSAVTPKVQFDVVTLK